MIQKYFKKALLLLVTTYSIGTTIFLIKNYVYAKEVVSKVDSYKITRGQVEEKIIHDYWNDTVSSLTNNILLMEEAKKLGIDNVSQHELEMESNFVKKKEKTGFDLSVPKDKQYITERIIIKKLAKKYTVDDSTLNKFLSEVKGDLGDHSYNAVVFEGGHDLIEKLENELRNSDTKNVEKKYGIKLNEAKIDEGNIYGVDPHEIIVGDVIHLHDGNKHLVLKILSSDTKLIKSLEEDRDRVMETYLNKHFFREKINVINYLRSKYMVEIR